MTEKATRSKAAGKTKASSSKTTAGKKTKPAASGKKAASGKAAAAKKTTAKRKKTAAGKGGTTRKTAAKKSTARKTTTAASRKTGKTAARKKATASAVHAAQPEVLLTSENSGFFPDLSAGLKSVFKKMHKSQVHHEHAQEQIIADFTSRMEKVFQQFHAEFDEREKVLEKKLQYVEKDQEREIRRVKWLSVPTGLLAIAGLVYVFYVVHIMERSMTSMSADMQHISKHIATMSEDTRGMTDNIATMSQSMNRIDYRMANMDRNMGQLSYSMVPIGKAAHKAEPMMSAMRTFMPF